MTDRSGGPRRGQHDGQTSRPIPQPHPYHPTARARSPPQSPPLLQTQNLSSPRQHEQQAQAPQTAEEQEQLRQLRFSWSDTPVDVQPRPQFVIVSPSTTIDESPISFIPPPAAQRRTPRLEQQTQYQQQQQQYQYTEPLPPLPQMPNTPPQQHNTPTATYSLYPKERPSPERVGTSGTLRSQDVHPAFSAPYAEPVPSRNATPVAPTPSSSPPPTQPKPRSRAGSNGVPLRILTSPTTNIPILDAKTTFPHEAPPIPASDVKHAPSSSPATPAISTPRLAPRTPTYDPNSLTGPNVQVGDSHRPGQISHPNAAHSASWIGGGMCAGDALCFEAILCPCAVYGRVQYRLAQKASRREATDLLGHSWCNGNCMIFGLACGLQGLLAMIQRTRVRKAYRIDGGLVSDCVRSCCCCCCAVAQSEREVREREIALRRHAGPAASAVPYVSPAEGMTYAPPPR